MTGCGCLLLVGLLAVLLYLFTFGSTDAGEPVAQAAALTALAYAVTMVGRRSLQPFARS